MGVGSLKVTKGDKQTMNEIKPERKGFRIVELIIENFKNIKIAEITPTGGTVIISGENGAGKTAIIDAFWMALDQKSAIKENPDPIKHGEKHAKVVVNLGKYIVTRTWTEAKTYLKIENAEGAVFKSPGAMLASLIGELSFDPQAFSTMSEKEQLDTLLNTLDLPIDIPLLDTERKDLYNDRTQVNREVKALEGQLQGIVIPDDVPDEEMSSADIMADMQEASEQIATNQRGRDLLRTYMLEKDASERKIEDLKAQVADYEESLKQLVPEISKLSAEVDAMVDPDLEVFKCQMSDLEQTNALVRKKQERQVIADKLNTTKITSAGITSAIEDIDNQKADAIKNATMPVPGLSFNEAGVLYNGTPLKGCSESERIRVSVAMAMVLNPKIRVIRITDGSLLDDHNMKIIEGMAEEHGFQIWIERVDSSGKVGIFIQEGEVVADNQATPDDGEVDRAQGEMPGMPMPGDTK